MSLYSRLSRWQITGRILLADKFKSSRSPYQKKGYYFSYCTEKRTEYSTQKIWKSNSDYGDLKTNKSRLATNRGLDGGKSNNRGKNCRNLVKYNVYFDESFYKIKLNFLYSTFYSSMHCWHGVMWCVTILWFYCVRILNVRGIA